jgi:hypothetical protein
MTRRREILLAVLVAVLGATTAALWVSGCGGDQELDEICSTRVPQTCSGVAVCPPFMTQRGQVILKDDPCKPPRVGVRCCQPLQKNGQSCTLPGGGC